jgi:Fe-S oxidoreductase
MLTLAEKVIFGLAALLSLAAALWVARRIARTIGRGEGRPDWGVIPKRLLAVLVKTGTLAPTFRLRLGPSLFHAMVAWGFIFFLLVNLGDLLEAFIPNFVFLRGTTLGSIYRFLADVLSVGVLVGMTALIIRRWVLRPVELTTRRDVLLAPEARQHIRRDSAIVGGFILIHVGSRFLGRAVMLALHGADPAQPLASLASGLFRGLNEPTLTVLEHVFFWGAMGTILGFIPYFLISKHLHLMMAPLNFLLKPERRSMGQLDKIDFDDESIEEFGAQRLEDLGWEQIMDAYACIMCYRCQQVCPAYNTGKVLSPAALEINKRTLLNQEGGRLARGEASSQTLTEFAITPEAVWACTACGACIDICPVGNEPMRDILDIRRALVLMENEFPKQLQTAFRGMERQGNPWSISGAERMRWAEGLDVPTIDENPTPDVLWWVGCAPATDARAQKTARAFATLLRRAGVNYAVLGEAETCTGDSARRAGREDIFFGLAQANVETLNEVAAPRIVTTCPHCFHTLKNEYPAFGGSYQVIHHTQLLEELIAAGKLRPGANFAGRLTFHDPCYLGRQNGVLAAPRADLLGLPVGYVEMEHHGEKSFCCGAGGAQMWKEEEEGTQRVNAARFAEAVAVGADTLAVACPFCMVMLTDAKKDAASEMAVLDVAEILLASMEEI